MYFCDPVKYSSHNHCRKFARDCKGDPFAYNDYSYYHISFYWDVIQLLKNRDLFLLVPFQNCI